MVLTDLTKKFKEIKTAVAKVNFADVKLSNSFKLEYENYLSKDQPGGFSEVEWADFSAKITTKTGKNIYLPNFWFYVAFELSNYLDGLSEQRSVFKEIFKGEDLQEKANSLRKGISDNEKQKIQSYFSSNDLNQDDYEAFCNFIKDYASWGGGKTIDREDYYVSALLKAGNLLAETQTAVAEIASQMSKRSTLKKLFNPIFVEPSKHEENSIRPEKNKINLETTPLPKPFILLAGISGTGKTRFVREQAKLSGTLNENYCLVSVRPDWHEPSDLLGYVSRLSDKPQYIATNVLRFIVKAWRDIIKSIDFEDGLPFDWVGHEIDCLSPYWLCLDEMNLAPVEQYFADYLSILETRTIDWSNDKYAYHSDPLICGSVFTSLDVGIEDNEKKPSDFLAKDLGFNLTEELDRDIWNYFKRFGIGIPFNLIVVGTVNMDETTHGFSRKVIDRALTIDFGEFFPNDFTEFFAPQFCAKSLSYPVLIHAKQNDLETTFDKDGRKTIDFLQAINDLLKSTPFELAFRALNELLLSVACINPQDEKTLHAIWDDFVMCKILPRIEGDIDKLSLPDSDKTILEQLDVILSQQLFLIWDDFRPDFYREKMIADAEANKTINIECRSKKKILWMQQRLEVASFTSFWP